jgi:hypothetical protein
MLKRGERRVTAEVQYEPLLAMTTAISFVRKVHQILASYATTNLLISGRNLLSRHDSVAKSVVVVVG